MNALDDLRGVVRIARAASFGASRNAPRIERARTAVAAVQTLVACVGAAIAADWAAPTRAAVRDAHAAFNLTSNSTPTEGSPQP